MKTDVIVAVVAMTLACLVSEPANAQQINVTDVETAIRCGLKEVKCEPPVLTPSGRFQRARGYELEVIPPLGRVYLAARSAKDKYLRFTRADVTPEMTAPEILIRARNSSRDMSPNVNVLHIVLLPKGKKDGAVQPAKEEAWDFEARNLAGASFTRAGKVATFDVNALPDGEFDVVIVNDSRWGEQRAGIDAKDRVALKQWSVATVETR